MFLQVEKEVVEKGKEQTNTRSEEINVLVTRRRFTARVAFIAALPRISKHLVYCSTFLVQMECMHSVFHPLLSISP